VSPLPSYEEMAARAAAANSGFDVDARLHEMARERTRRRDEDLALRHLAAAARRGDLRIDGGRLVMTVPRELLGQQCDEPPPVRILVEEPGLSTITVTIIVESGS
jgi:hypothetical protein